MREGGRESNIESVFLQVEGMMNGTAYQVGKFSHSLRCHLFKEHLGLLAEQTKPRCTECSSQIEAVDVSDPASEEFYSTWSKIAAKNIGIFEKVCVVCKVLEYVCTVWL